MSIINTVAAALNGTPQRTVAIAEALGLELTQVSPALTALSKRGEALRSEEGWIASTGEAATKPAKRKTKQTAELPPPPEPESDGRTLEFAMSESGAILMRAADQSWEWLAMSAADVAALRKLIARAG